MRRWQRPSWLAWLLLIGGLGLFLSLARWQLQRAAEKDSLLQTYAQAATAPVQALAGLPEALPAQLYPRVHTRGSYVAGRGYWLDQQVRQGKVGRLAIAVFAPRDGQRRLLVNLGWVEKPAGTPEPAWPALPSGEVELHGIYAPPPGSGLRLGGNALEQQARWPKLTVYLDLAAVAADLQAALHPRLLLLDADPASGLAREWTPVLLSPAKHRGYAFQWFSFAVAALVIFVVLHWRQPKQA